MLYGVETLVLFLKPEGGRLLASPRGERTQFFHPLDDIKDHELTGRSFDRERSRARPYICLPCLPPEIDTANKPRM